MRASAIRELVSAIGAPRVAAALWTYSPNPGRSRHRILARQVFHVLCPVVRGPRLLDYPRIRRPLSCRFHWHLLGRSYGHDWPLKLPTLVPRRRGLERAVETWVKYNVS